MENKETLEEAVNNYYDSLSIDNLKLAFRNGANWQAERNYSELEIFLGELKDKVDSFEYSVNQNSYIQEHIDLWFENFKKK